MSIQKNSNNQLLKITDAADRLSISRSKLYELLRAGRITELRIGRSVRISTFELDRFIESLGEGMDIE